MGVSNTWCVCVVRHNKRRKKDRSEDGAVVPAELPTKRRARLARSPAHVAKAANAASCDYTQGACLRTSTCVRVSGCYVNIKREEATLGRGAWVAVAGY